MSLRVLPPGPPRECHGCSRRAVLKGFAITAATALIGCPSEPDPAPDAPPTSAVTMCGTNLCIDLDDPLNGSLASVDGSLTVAAPGDRILVVRTSSTALLAISDVCTHAGCGVRYDRAAKILVCPCHGSQYSLTGKVLRGPATTPLARYTTQFDQGASLLTIML